VTARAALLRGVNVGGPVIAAAPRSLTLVSLPFILASALLAASACAETVLRSGPARARLVELYTSEGCSSCPPADAWLSSLAGERGLWKDFVPVEFHVTYWDDLGWPDRLADKAFTARQRAYAASWGRDSVYTPGFVLDGREWRAWGRTPPKPDAAAGVLIARAADGRVRVTWTPAAEGAAFDVYAARLGFGLLTRVGAGENSGRALRHDFVARSLSRAALTRKDGRWSAELDLPPAAAGERAGLAVWIAGPDGRPLQAAGGFLH